MSSDDTEVGIEMPSPTRGTEEAAEGAGKAKKRVDWKALLGGSDGNRKRNTNGNPNSSGRTSLSDLEQNAPHKGPTKWSMGMLNDRQTEQVPGSILLLSAVSEFNEPLGLQNARARTSVSSLSSHYRRPSQQRRSLSSRRAPAPERKKRTADGKIILEPQPDDSLNDPLNWQVWRRDLALGSVGFYSMLGGGMTPILAAGFKEVAANFNVAEPRVALTTGLYMLGLGIGSVVLAPTAILYGKRPVYLAAALGFILTSVWCALSPTFASLIVARVCMGIAVSSVECLPSASIAEIYFLHEKAYRLGIYTLLLLGGKNLVPLISAVIIQSLGWRWVFWIVAMVVGFAFVLLFFFVPETFWDRTPRPRKLSRRFSHAAMFRPRSLSLLRSTSRPTARSGPENEKEEVPEGSDGLAELGSGRKRARFDAEDEEPAGLSEGQHRDVSPSTQPEGQSNSEALPSPASVPPQSSTLNTDTTDMAISPSSETSRGRANHLSPLASPSITYSHPGNPFTETRRDQPPVTFLSSLHPISGRLTKDKWLRVAARPFILYTYPSILWSALVYSLSVGWLIVLSESVATIYEARATYNFTSLQTGLVYISPFVGGILGTAVAGKVSDRIVRYLARRNGGVYEPEFRLVMALPIAIFTTIGLMGYGWSAAERDAWIVPTVFFGFISFGCSLGSTTAITFAVDSYRQYAGEALVTLNFSKNVFHGLVFSLFFNNWLDDDGSKLVFVAIGSIQLACLLTTIPMYIYGKRARMWTVRRDVMERLLPGAKEA